MGLIELPENQCYFFVCKCVLAYFLILCDYRVAHMLSPQVFPYQEAGYISIHSANSSIVIILKDINEIWYFVFLGLHKHIRLNSNILQSNFRYSQIEARQLYWLTYNKYSITLLNKIIEKKANIYRGPVHRSLCSMTQCQPFFKGRLEN